MRKRYNNATATNNRNGKDRPLRDKNKMKANAVEKIRTLYLKVNMEYSKNTNETAWIA
ncbi:MAG: hypothetical protein ACO1NV_15505 [Leptospira bouyouniensis]